MNAFEPLFWMGCAYLLIRIVKTGNPKLWIWFGILSGVGLENKYSMLIFGAGIVVGLLLTPQRRALSSPWLWIGGAIAFLIFLPNLLWNIQHHFPFLELQANIRRSGRDVPLRPLAFFAQEILTMLPLTLPIWLAGLWFYFFSKPGKPFRALGWAWVFTAAVIVTLSPRDLLPLSRLSGFVCRRQRDVGSVARPAATPMAETRLSRLDGRRRRRVLAARRFRFCRPKRTFDIRRRCISSRPGLKRTGWARCRSSSPTSSAGRR